MSRDLLRRKKKRFLKTGGLNPPVDLADLSYGNSAAEADTDPAEEQSLNISAVNEDKSGSDEDYLDLVFADLFREQEKIQYDYVPDFIRRSE